MAKALDVIGDRWTLLIIRELMLAGPCRYTDLRNGLPGIATNLLAERLRELEEDGVVYREAAPPPIATTLFHLTPRGRDLLPVIRELGRWGGPLLADAKDDEAFRSHWIALPLELYYYDPTPAGPRVAIELHMGDEPPMVIETADGKIQSRRGRAQHPDGVLSGPARLVIGVLSGRVDLQEARTQGLQFDGDLEVLTRVRSSATQAPNPSSSAA